MQFYKLTDCGIRRENNEDFCAAETILGYTVLIVADGMGGHNGGEVASRHAVETVMESIRKNIRKSSDSKEIYEIMRKAISCANSEILEMAQKEETLEGMGTTIDVCIADEVSAHIAHIGDSRVYKIDKDGVVSRITRDHSLIEYMLEAGTITPDEAAEHPQRNMITRALGTEEAVEADVYESPLHEGDILLLCSDGLTNMVSEEEVGLIVTASESVQEAAETLVKRANESGGMDNITVIVAKK